MQLKCGIRKLYRSTCFAFVTGGKFKENCPGYLSVKFFIKRLRNSLKQTFDFSASSNAIFVSFASLLIKSAN